MQHMTQQESSIPASLSLPPPSYFETWAVLLYMGSLEDAIVHSVLDQCYINRLKLVPLLTSLIS